jgi:hypothetical protein
MHFLDVPAAVGHWAKNEFVTCASARARRWAVLNTILVFALSDFDNVYWRPGDGDDPLGSVPDGLHFELGADLARTASR